MSAIAVGVIIVVEEQGSPTVMVNVVEAEMVG
jgi:hypothetical protein